LHRINQIIETLCDTRNVVMQRILKMSIMDNLFCSLKKIFSLNIVISSELALANFKLE